jgi:hypothetical protein
VQLISLTNYKVTKSHDQLCSRAELREWYPARAQEKTPVKSITECGVVSLILAVFLANARRAIRLPLVINIPIINQFNDVRNTLKHPQNGWFVHFFRLLHPTIFQSILLSFLVSNTITDHSPAEKPMALP